MTGRIWFLGVAVLMALRGQAAVQFAPIFNNGAVLQCEMPVNVWGSAEPGETVTVSFAGQKKTAIADSEGSWKLQLDPMAASSKPQTLSAVSLIKNQKSEIANVVVGEVWLATGQSNMVYPLKLAAGGSARMKLTLPEIRFAVVPKQAGLPPRPFSSEQLAWKTFAPPANQEIAAVAFYFAEKLQAETGRQIGILQCSYGGTPAEAWTPEFALDGKPELRYLAEIIRNGVASKSPEEWQEENRRYKEAAAARDEWRKTKKGPQPKSYPTPGPDNPWFQCAPTVLFENMLRPLIPYTARGVIWYQGESNAGKPDEYRVLFPAMIESWRNLWNRPDWPFFFVQLSAYDNPKDWPGLRAAQTFTRDTVPHTGMALALDCGEKEQIHPKLKQPVGERLALLALNQVYGRDVVSRGPIFQTLEKAGDTVQVVFDHSVKGLKTSDGNARLPGFEIAGPDGIYYPAVAEIVSANKVALKCPDVKKPSSVRYAWNNWVEPPATLQNSAGLPAEPFLHAVTD
jgi:sialate O-acetylesterase